LKFYTIHSVTSIKPKGTLHSEKCQKNLPISNCISLLTPFLVTK
jgi:hypothetical protein